MAIRVCHMTSAHPRADTRIFVKECRSLAVAGYEVVLVVADDKGEGLERVFGSWTWVAAGPPGPQLWTSHDVFGKPPP